MIPIALRVIDRVIGALFLLTIAIGPAAAANCDIFSCVTHHDAVSNFAGQPTIRSIQNGACSSAATWNLGRLTSAAFSRPRTYILRLRASDGALSATDTVTIRVAK